MNGIDRLANYIGSALNQSKKDLLKCGQVIGHSVCVDGHIYPADFAIDIPTQDGDWIYCVLDETKSVAVVVGK